MTDITVLSSRSIMGSGNASRIWPPEAVASLRGSPRSVILIHGYANAEDKAESSWVTFLKLIDRELEPQELWQAGVTVFGFTWPGDSEELLGIYNVVSFPLRIEPATLAGNRLGDLLFSLPDSTQVTLVAHSLGCRVLLAALTQLDARIDEQRELQGAGMQQQSHRGPHIAGIHLMAAAVPVFECGPESDIFTFRNPAQTSYFVNHSDHDRVLKVAFPLGSAPFGGPRTAVGSHGRPESRWSHSEYTGFGHSDYWKSERMAQLALQSILPGTTRAMLERQPPAWQLAEWRGSLTARVPASR